jgi:hypothetical protein
MGDSSQPATPRDHSRIGHHVAPCDLTSVADEVTQTGGWFRHPGVRREPSGAAFRMRYVLMSLETPAAPDWMAKGGVVHGGLATANRYPDTAR